MMLNKPDQVLKTLDDKMGEVERLRGALHSSLRLQDFCPAAFEHGPCTVGGRGNVQHAPEDAVVYIKQGNGALIEFPMLSFPYDLWPPTMKEEFKLVPAARRAKLLEKHQPET